MAAKFRILLLLLFAGFIAQAQVHLERSPASVLPTDQNLKVGHVLIIPTLTDTTAALSYGIDSLGMVIQIKSTGTWYKRDTLPGGRFWNQISTGGGGGAPTGPAGGSLSGSYPNPGIASAAVANSNMANMGASTVKGNKTASPAPPSDLTVSDLIGLLGLGTSAFLNVPASGNATTSQVVQGNDTRLADSRTPTGTAGGSFLNGTYPNPGMQANSITNTQLAQMGATRIKGNNTGGTANASDLTVAQVIAMLNAITNFSGVKFLGKGLYAAHPSGVDSGMYFAMDSVLTGGWFYWNGTTMINLTPQVSIQVLRLGSPGDSSMFSISGSVLTGYIFHIAAQRDSAGGCIHHAINPDGSWTWWSSCVVNAGSVNSFAKGVYASRPAASGNSGACYITTDSANISCSDGTSWTVVARANGSGGGGSGITASQVANTTPLSFPSGFQYFYDAYWSGTTANNYLTSGSVTVTMSGNNPQVAGGSNSIGNVYYKNVPYYNEHSTSIDTVTQVGASGANTFMGLGWEGGFRNTGEVNLSTGGTPGQLTIILNGVVVATSGTNLTFNSAGGDKFVQTFTQMRDSLTYTVKDITTSSTVTVTYIMANAFATVGTNVAHATGYYAFYPYGGTYVINGWQVINLNLSSIGALFGDSKIQGDFNGASWNNRISDQLNLTYGYTNIANFGASGETIDQMRSRSIDLFVLHPTWVGFSGGCNDLRNGKALSQTFTNLAGWLGTVRAHGIKVYIFQMPELGSNAAALRQYDSALRIQYRDIYISKVWDTIASNTASFIASDGIHLTAAGAAAVAYVLAHDGRLTNNTYAYDYQNPDVATQGASNIFRQAQTINSDASDTVGKNTLTVIGTSSGSGIGARLLIKDTVNTSGTQVTEDMQIDKILAGASSLWKRVTINGVAAFAGDYNGNIFIPTGAAYENTGTTIAFKNSRGNIWNMAFDLTYGTGDNVPFQLIAGAGGYGRIESVNGPLILGTNAGAYGVWLDADRLKAGSSPTFVMGVSGTNVPTLNKSEQVNNITGPPGAFTLFAHGAGDSLTYQIKIAGGSYNAGTNTYTVGGGGGGTTSPPFNSDASHPIVRDNADTTKLLALIISGITSGATTSVTVPNGGGTMMFTDKNQTVTGTNTFTPAQTFSGGFSVGTVTNAVPVTINQSITSGVFTGLQLNTTWNAAGTTETAADISIINTASNPASNAFRVRGGSAGTTVEASILANDGSFSNASGNFSGTGTAAKLANNTTNVQVLFDNFFGGGSGQDAILRGAPSATSNYFRVEDISDSGIMLDTRSAHGIVFVTNGLRRGGITAGGNLVMGQQPDLSTAMIQSLSASQPQFAAHYDATHYATWQVGSGGNLDIEHLTGLTINSGAIPTGTTTDSVLVETTSSNVATIKKVAQSSLGGGSSGIYVPTATGINFVTSATADSAVWTRNGNIVTVFGQVSVTPSANNSAVNLNISLPVASLLAGGHACWGTGTTIATVSGGAASTDAIITADPTNHVARMVITSSAAGSGNSIDIHYSFSYQVQ